MPADSRSRILELLIEKPRTTRELSEALDLTTNAVRQQLVHLERDGLVEVASERRTEGRPAHVYSVTDPETANIFLEFGGDPFRMAEEIQSLREVAPAH